MKLGDGRLGPRLRRALIPALGALVVLAVVGCEVLAPQSSVPQPVVHVAQPGVPARTVDGAASSQGESAAAPLTATVQLGTLTNTIDLPGQVTPGNSSELSFRTSGTISATRVTMGQHVSTGDALIDLSLDSDALHDAQNQASLADLAYQEQEAKVEQLEAAGGPSTTSGADAQLAVAKARSALAQAILARDNARNQPSSFDVQLAQLALDQAKDDEATAESPAADTTSHTAEASATGSATPTGAISLNPGGAPSTDELTRQLSEAQLKLQELQAQQPADQAARDLARQQAQQDVDSAKADLAQAQVDATRAQEDAQNLPSSNDDGVTRAQQAVASATVQLAQAQSDKTMSSDVRSATLAMDQLTLQQANEALAKAQLAAQRAKDDAAASGLSPKDAAVQADQLKVQEAQNKLDTLNAQYDPENQLEQLQIADAADLVNQDQAALAAARGTAPTDTPKVRAAKRAVEEATIKLQQAQASAAQQQSAAPTQSDAYDDAVAAAQAELDAAQAEAQIAGAGSSANSLQTEQLRAQLLLDESVAAHQAAQPMVTLTAPFSGQVTSLGATIGQIVQAGAPVVRLDDASRLSIAASAPEAQQSQLFLNQAVTVTFAGLPNITANGTIASIGGSAQRDANSSNVTFSVQILLNQVPADLKVGMSATAHVVTQEADSVLYVPSSTVRTEGSDEIVTVVLPNGDQQQETVVTGPTFGTNIEILSGLDAGDIVAFPRPVT